ncbi:MAG TPA: GTPase Era [Luteibaculaceae bacterium]|nr:GTPase Era [Luteibaculaceae bacterium]
MHKAGFVNIIGSPNVGKSTLMNELVGERLSIITSKAQTTRHRIVGIVNEPEYQIVFSDTPGVLRPSYKLHESMMGFVGTALKDADVLLLMVEPRERSLNNPEVLERIKKSSIPLILLINKMDQSNNAQLDEAFDFWKNELPRAIITPVSALHKFNIDFVKNKIVELLPESPPYYGKEELTDRPVRFFVTETIREKILLHYDKEIPYSCEVVVESYTEEPEIDRISVVIYVERDSQKGILIGKGGNDIKRVGTEARKDLEKFLQKKVFMEIFVKVDKDWRNEESKLKKYGYNS